MSAITPVVATTPPEPVASRRHTLVLVFILVAITVYGFHLQHSPPPLLGTGESAARNGQATLLVVTAISEWLLILYVWLGVRGRPHAFRHLILGERKNWKAIILEVLIAAPFWMVWRQTATWVGHLVGPSHGPAGPLVLPPEGPLNIALWFAVSTTAGFAEEIIYRGYLQKQLQALTGSVAFAVILQAILFGFGHTYQGLKAVFVISILGLLYGLLAAWRKNLLPGMVSHAWSDMFAGYFRFL